VTAASSTPHRDASAHATRDQIAVQVRNVGVTFGQHTVLAHIDVDIPAGTIFGIVGPNGAGKTTLLRAMAGTLSTGDGAVLILGRPLADLPVRERAKLVAVVPQVAEAPASLRVRDLTMLGRHPHIGFLARESARDHAVVERALLESGCESFADRPLGSLSGGERRRAFIARALAQEPRLLLLDEPTANLDPGAGVELLDLLHRLAKGGVTVVMVAHDLTLAAAYCDRIALLADGRLLHEGVPSEVLTTEQVQAAYGRRVEMIADPRTGALLLAPSAEQHQRIGSAQ
jgi:iron complex transport system ATP-binding protein